MECCTALLCELPADLLYLIDIDMISFRYKCSKPKSNLQEEFIWRSEKLRQSRYPVI